MKILILSDVHSNVVALEAIWRQEADADAIYCTGDLVDHGPFPRQVIAWVQAHNVRCTRGNHDGWVASRYRAGLRGDAVPRHDRGWVHHNAALLNEHEIQFLEKLPERLAFSADGFQYGMRHLYVDYHEIVSLHAFDAYVTEHFTGALHPRLIFGHTHRQAIRLLSSECLWMNPGSSSYRRQDDPDTTAHYITIVDGAITLHRLEYDRTPLLAELDNIALSQAVREAALRMFS